MSERQKERSSCPKCGSILTEEDNLSGECPKCLIVFEKYEKVQAAKLAKAEELSGTPEEGEEKDSCFIGIHKVLRKIGVYEFVLKLTGLIALIVFIYGAAYVYYTVFEPGKNDSSRSSAVLVKQPAAASVKDNFGACLTKDLLNQLFDAQNSNDEMALAWLMANGCVVTRKEWKISVTDRGILKSRIRVYAGAGTMEMWVDSGSISE